MSATIRRLAHLGLGLLISSVTACEGTDNATTGMSGDASAASAATEGGEAASTGDDAESGGEGSGSGSTGAPADDEDPFDLNRENLRLLPFNVRLNRLSLLLDRPTDDPIFAVMLARRYDLGDYNHAQGINPDLSWGSARMAAWVAALRPICNSAAMKDRYPEFPLDLPELMRDAYGYTPTADELAPFLSLFHGADDPDAPDPGLGDKGTGPIDPLSPAARYELGCLAVLTSLEFVAQ